MRKTALLLVAGLALAVTPNCSAQAKAPAPAVATATAPSSKLAVVILENRDRARAENEMPYLAGLERQYAGATHYHAVADPSLPNYLAMAFGNDFGITDDANAKKHPLNAQSVFGATIQLGNTAHVYAESEQTPCSLVDQGTDGYKVRHTAWPYAAHEGATCRANMTGLQPLAGDEANGMPTLSWIIGDVTHDAHRPSNTRIADGWLKNTIMPGLLGSPDFKSGALTVVVTFDEGRDLTSTGSTIMFVVLNASLDGAHLQVTDTLDHYDFWRSQLRYGGATTSGVDALSGFGL